MSTSGDTPTTTAGPARVAFVGAGPGDPGLLTVRGRDLLAQADAVVTDTMTTAEVLRTRTRDDARIVDGAHGRPGNPVTHAARSKLIVATAKATTSGRGRGLVVRVMDGDPGTYHGLAAEITACRREGIEVEVVPGVSAVHAAPTYAGVALHSDESPSLLTISGAPARADWSGAASEAVTVVLLGTVGELATGLARILAAGRDPATPVALTEHGTTMHQRTHTSTLSEAADLLHDGAVGEPSLVVVGSTVARREDLSWFETRPLFGWRVLVPRTKDQAGPTLERLERYGAVGEVVPTISVEPPRTPQQMQRAIKGLVTGRYEWIGFTSVNAVRAVREKLAEIGLDVRAFAGLKIAAVGGATEQALRQWGLQPDLVPTGEQSARGLLEVWPPFDDVLDPINGVLLPRADIATETLVAGLQEMGWEVDDVTAYRTVRAAPPAAPIRDAIKQGAFDAVLFTSSSTVRNLVGIAGKPHPSTVVACIGPATVKTAQEHGLTVSVLAEQASSDALVDGLAAFGGALRAQAEAAGEAVVRPSARRATGRRKAR